MSVTPESLVAEILSAGYASHTRPYHGIERAGLSSYLFRLQTEGSAYALVEGKMTKVNAGDLLLYRPGDGYELRIDPEESGTLRRSFDYFLFCRGTWMDAWWSQAVRPRVLHVPVEDGILPLWRQLILERRKTSQRPEDMLIRDYLLRSLCLIIDRVTKEVHQRSQSANAFVAHRMKAFVEQSVTSPFTVSDVANHVGLSVSRAVHLFKETFGQTLMEFALEVRLAIACEHIQYGSMSLEQAAFSAGFGSYSYFHRVFKERFGVTPRAYREMHL